MPRHLRSVPLPRFGAALTADPPYDDERPAAGPASAPPYVQGTLALACEEADLPRPGRVRPVRTPGERRLRALGQAFAEVLAGRRPAATVAAHATARAYAELRRAGRIIDADGPPFASRPHISMPTPDAIEMCLLVHCARRRRVLALRLERRGVQWLCTDFETTP
ncbi:hypothetical protein Misp01_04510 [Microtetraspora sp. NBRC 13810]|uniref:Rv3235 family protein n=1 Tax=Microtetraspora sp. NBRC 13810 TaxID=3030990 RepID=UPI0024A29292|nr:Rv3235 family protein [Microtetraspora sp. NBRC 13810]GLW05321.1 hypothetical protein Misp01_04510 [Microtetraspora sp. NBRC 13810]